MSHSNQTTTNHNPDAEDKDQNNNVFTDSPTVLSFSSMDWRDVPMDCVWGVMEHITILELDDNRLTKLPPFLLEALPCLERLDVARNRLTQLPSNIGYWKQLKMISVPGNRVTSCQIFLNPFYYCERYFTQGLFSCSRLGFFPNPWARCQNWSTLIWSSTL